jgi:UPF0716 protein FxsA
LLRLILFALLVAVPIAEIAVFLVVGDVIGALATLGLIVLTAFIGTVLLRQQGLAAFRRLQEDLRNDRVPAAAIGHAITVAIAGALLLTPGFITDGVGFLLFIPGVRTVLWRQILKSVKVHRIDPETGSPFGPAGPGGFGQAPRGGPQTIDLDNDDYGPSDPSSPWRGDSER